MIRLKPLIIESVHEDAVRLVADNFDTITGNYEEWLETQLDDLLDAGDIDAWNRYDTLVKFWDNSDSPEEFAAYVRYQYELYDPEQLLRFLQRYLKYENIA